MADTTAIAWTDSTFNPWMGCTRVSPGCGQGDLGGCYAEKSPAVLFRGIKWGPGQPRVRTSAANWKKPLAWNRAAEKAGERRRVFCASLADVFDPEAPGEWRSALWSLILRTPALDWLLLTKRPENFQYMLPAPPLMPNVWLGVTVENQEQAEKRIPLLLAQQAAVRFLSVEPLLGPVDLRAWARDLRDDFWERRGNNFPRRDPGIDWVIVGGESGPKARPFHLAWARSILAQCRAAGVPFFMKQAGARPVVRRTNLNSVIDDDWDEEVKPKHKSGADPAEWPEDLRVREFPRV